MFFMERATALLLNDLQCLAPAVKATAYLPSLRIGIIVSSLLLMYYGGGFKFGTSCFCYYR